MTREIAHQLSFEKALHAIQPNFPQGKLPGMPEFTNKYFNMSGEPNVRGAWNQGGDWEYGNRHKRLSMVAMVRPRSRWMKRTPRCWK